MCRQTADRKQIENKQTAERARYIRKSDRDIFYTKKARERNTELKFSEFGLRWNEIAETPSM